jgi:N-formylglutamate amidohydrolase
MTDHIYRLLMPAAPTSVAVFNSPHSGRDYPAAFLAQTVLDRFQIRSSEDAFVDDLFESAPDFGAPLLAARVPRACVDLNRAPDELDPALIAGVPRRASNPRVAAGLGVIPRVVAEGRPIFAAKLSLAEAERRIAVYHRPYHARLGRLMEDQSARSGRAILFDCHSMPRDALASVPTVRGRRPDVILGDRFGAACARWVIEAAAEAFRSAGFAVARNAPFAGGFITQHYGRPAAGWHALQIEIDRGLYMDERRIEPKADFDAVRTSLRAVVAGLARIDAPGLPLAAE